MPLEQAATSGQIVNAYQDAPHAQVTIAGVQYRHSLFVMPERTPELWSVTQMSEITQAGLETLQSQAPEVILLGSGASQQLLAPALQQFCFRARLACEVMNNASACRTYNVLAGEGRKVLLALILPFVRI